MKIGIDIVSNERISKIYEKYGEKFLNKILIPSEINSISRIKNLSRKIEKIAGIFSAKEAVIKCFNRKISFKAIKIEFTSSGSPVAIVGDKRVEISISHEKDFTIALAVFQ